MIGKHKWKLLISSAVILLPAVFGLALWNELPGEMAIHWGTDGAENGWSSRGFAVFGLPVLLLLLHWLCIFLTGKDPKNKDQNRKVFGMVFWLCPGICVFASGVMYAAALEKEFPFAALIPLLLGLLFFVIGNYMPKCRQNYTVGIRVKWTLESEENWAATHRFAGKVWALGGVLLMACAFLPEKLIFGSTAVFIAVLTAAPVVFSRRYHKKQVREGTAVTAPQGKSCSNRIIVIITCLFSAVILVFVGVMMFTGNITVHYGDESFEIEASYWGDLTVNYDAVETVEYRDVDKKGIRTNGLGSARLLAGAFRNDEFGHYTRYSYTQCDACVVLTGDGGVLVLSGPDAEETKEIYEEISSRIS